MLLRNYFSYSETVPDKITLPGQVFWRLQIPDNAEVVDSQGSGLELQLADKTTLEVR